MSMFGTREEYETKCTSGPSSNGPKKLNLARCAVIVTAGPNRVCVYEFVTSISIFSGPAVKPF